MRPDQHALEKAMRVGFEVPAILEGAGLALIAVDRHQTRTGLADHRAPFPARGKARTTETTQRRVVERLQQIFLRQRTGTQSVQQRITAGSSIGVAGAIVW